MPRRKTRCTCKVCRSCQKPVDYRTVQEHLSRYGQHIVESPYKSFDIPNTNGSSCPASSSPRQKRRKLLVSDCDDKLNQDSATPLTIYNRVHNPDHEHIAGIEEDNSPSITSACTFGAPTADIAMDNWDKSITEHETCTLISKEELLSDSFDETDSDNSSTVSSEQESDSEDYEVTNTRKESQCSMQYDKSVYKDRIAIEKMSNYPNVTVLQWLAMKFHLFSSHPSMSKTQFSNELRMDSFLNIGNITGEGGCSSYKIPVSYKEARRLIDPYVCPKQIYCVCENDCLVFTDGEKVQQCAVCKSIKKKQFIYLPLGPRLVRYFGEESLAKLVQSHPGDTYQCMHSDMWDVHDSPMWKAMYSPDGHFKGQRNGISLAFEMDGVNPYHNIGVQYSMTPMMFTLLNLPRKTRNAFGNILLVGIIPGSGKAEASKLNPYLDILVDELLQLTNCETYDSYLKAPVQVKVKLLMYILDYPGLSKLFNLQGSGGISACHWCHARGEYCSILKKVIYPCNHLYLASKSRFPRLRDEKSEKMYRDAYDKSSTQINKSMIASATGCKGTYALERLTENIHRINETQPDACHTVKDVTQNVMKLFTNKGMELSKIVESEEKRGRSTIDDKVDDRCYAFKQSNKQKTSTSTMKQPRAIYKFVMTDNEMKIADERASSIRPPLDFGVKPAPFICKNSFSLKSHDWKQLACQGILKFCLRGCLAVECRKSFFKLLDALTALCEEHQCLDNLPALESKVNEALIAMENDLPLSLQNITTHILHHVVKGIRTFGPVYGTWMFVYERFNSWICKRTLNMRHPEATVIETYRIYDWCQFMIQSGKMPEGFTEAFSDDASDHDLENSLKVKHYPRKRELQAIHKTCPGCSCTVDNCIVFKCHRLGMNDPTTGRSLLYSSKKSQKSSTKTDSSFVCFELDKGEGCQKLSPGKYLFFGQIEYFLFHNDEVSGSLSRFASIVQSVDCQFDEETSLWFMPAMNNRKGRRFLISMDKVSPPLVTAIDNGNLWILNSKKRPYN